eukprot:7578102-Prorocentrum_lima.AAC.1
MKKLPLDPLSTNNKRTDAQTHRRTGAQTHKRTDAQTHRRTDAQTVAGLALGFHLAAGDAPLL